MLDALPDIVRILFKPMKAWLGFRKDKKRFIFMPEVFLLRKMRNAFMKH
jgi:hypothetical protein